MYYHPHVRNRIPPISPYGLIQETLWPDEWKILIACMMLNCTTRKQVDKVAPVFFRLWPTPQALLDADPVHVATVCRSLGFANRRTSNMLKMSKAYIEANWKHAGELPGIGQYAARSWEIFCKATLGETPPQDHALVKYWNFCKQRGYM